MKESDVKIEILGIILENFEVKFGKFADFDPQFYRIFGKILNLILKNWQK